MIITIPFTQEKNQLGKEYNRIMLNTMDPWVGFMDHDMMFIPGINWHQILNNIINTHGEKLGFIGCMTNKTGSLCGQRANGIDQGQHDMMYHFEKGHQIYKEFGDSISDVSKTQFDPSALLFLTHRDVWKKVGGFIENGFLGVDTDYSKKLKASGYKLLIAKGLYVYHWYRAKPNFTTKVREEKIVSDSKIHPVPTQLVTNREKINPIPTLPRELGMKISEALASGEYLITIHRKKSKGRDGFDRDHFWLQNNFEDEVVSSLDHVKNDFENKHKRKIVAPGFV